MFIFSQKLRTTYFVLHVSLFGVDLDLRNYYGIHWGRYNIASFFFRLNEQDLLHSASQFFFI